MEKILIIGSGGHCKVIIDLIKSSTNYEIAGIIENDLSVEDVLGIPIIGCDEDIFKFYRKGIKNAFVCIGDITVRTKIFELLKQTGFTIPTLIHKRSIISEFCSLQMGTCIMAGVIINAGSYIGENCIINTGAIIEHDCIIGNNTNISPRVSLAGGVKVGENSYIGLGSTVIQQIDIENNVFIGAGAVVVNNIPQNTVGYGVPCKIVKEKIKK